MRHTEFDDKAVVAAMGLITLADDRGHTTAERAHGVYVMDGIDSSPFAMFCRLMLDARRYGSPIWPPFQV